MFTYTVVEHHVTRVLWAPVKPVEIRSLIHPPVHVARSLRQFEVAEILNVYSPIRGYPQREGDAHPAAEIEGEAVKGIILNLQLWKIEVGSVIDLAKIPSVLDPANDLDLFPVWHQRPLSSPNLCAHVHDVHNVHMCTRGAFGDSFLQMSHFLICPRKNGTSRERASS
jgi:hypothetical protein